MNEKDYLIDNVTDGIIKELNNSRDFLILISPFIKINALDRLLSIFDSKPRKIIVLSRWLPEDLLSGVSDLEVYERVKKWDGEMFINERLHAKIYISDYKSALIGSANLTDKGLGFASKNNLETVTKIDCTSNFMSEINLLIDSSIKINDDIYFEYKNFVEKYKDEYRPHLPSTAKEDIEYIKFMLKNSERGGLFVHDFPLTSKPNDCSTETQKKFLASPAYIWQKKVIVEPMSFGKYSELLHAALCDIPAPYRKQVKDLVINMYGWTKVFSQEFKFETSNYSRVIKPVYL